MQVTLVITDSLKNSTPDEVCIALLLSDICDPVENHLQHLHSTAG